MTTMAEPGRGTSAAFGTMFVIAAIGTIAGQAQTYPVLHRFTGADGSGSEASLIRDAAGNLYGTTTGGGASGDGVVFKLDATGLTVLHSFSLTDGALPWAGLMRDSVGNLYGTTTIGGASGEGVVFKLDATGTETVLHSFTGMEGFPGTDGARPYASLIRDLAGNLYGTTEYGGTSGYGTVFKLDTTGTLTVLHSFRLGRHGAGPTSGLIRDPAGILYGTAPSGGTADLGVVFKLDNTGETVLHTFTRPDGVNPGSTLIQDSAGNLYGTTTSGGPTNNGTVYKVDTTGTETVLYGFTGGMDGGDPAGGLIQDSAGNLYGTTFKGGASGNGVVFTLDAAGTETVLHSFAGGSDGANPAGAMVRDAAGNLYGTTYSGGIARHGVIFKIAP